MTWNLQICCEPMEEAVQYKDVLVDEREPTLFTVFDNKNTASLSYCPWCGKIISFRRDEE